MAVARSLTFGCRVVGSSICPIGAAEHAPSDRLRIALKQCVAAKGYPKVAALMSMGVIVGGAPFFANALSLGLRFALTQRLSGAINTRRSPGYLELRPKYATKNRFAGSRWVTHGPPCAVPFFKGFSRYNWSINHLFVRSLLRKMNFLGGYYAKRTPFKSCVLLTFN